MAPGLLSMRPHLMSVHGVKLSDVERYIDDPHKCKCMVATQARTVQQKRNLTNQLWAFRGYATILTSFHAFMIAFGKLSVSSMDHISNTHSDCSG